ncbi:hypothetical protein JP75_23585 [Devosia riboflavina]|uniref:DUF3828 domain-containing protein n=1 Tax=Devosia riboflavina TaxID=46914 RepID=A0A087LWI2_9HYPH|nr:hypothetical protein [Devosia riboflavina]KFL28985.1 hypothetical protein JP75_23585 [Devosia riboflavina]
MLRALPFLGLSLLALPAFSAPIPVFDEPKALLEAIYGQIESYEEAYTNGTFDPEDSFDDVESFSTRLGTLLQEADEKLFAAGSEMGALDFSPFINGQDSGGQTYVIHDPKVKGGRAIGDVDILLSGDPLYTITFQLVDEGAARGWKIDEILLPNGDSEGSWPLSEYLASPLVQ